MSRLMLFFLVSCCFSYGVQLETLTSKSGSEIQAIILKVEGDTVNLRRSDGVRFQVSLNIFDQVSQEKIISFQDSLNQNNLKTDSKELPNIQFEKINEILGNKLFTDFSLWDDDPEAVAYRLKWPKESRTEYSQSFRFYPPSEYKFASVRPYSAALYGDKLSTTGVSLVFANKGDCFASAGTGEDHFKQGDVTKDIKVLENWIERDEEQITQVLISILGQAKRQNNGQGSAKRKVSR